MRMIEPNMNAANLLQLLLCGEFLAFSDQLISARSDHLVILVT